MMSPTTFHQRITSVEHHMGLLCSVVSQYTTALAKLRDRGDLLASCIHELAKADPLSRSQAVQLPSVACCVAAVQDYRHLLCNRLDGKVVACLCDQSAVCSRAQAAARKHAGVAFVRGSKKSHARAQSCSRASAQLQRVLDDFEQHKLTVMRTVLRDLLQSELAFHAKAVECYTQACQHLANVDTDADMEVFRNCLRGASAGPDGGLTDASIPAVRERTVSPAIAPPSPRGGGVRPRSWHGAAIRQPSSTDSEEDDEDGDKTEESSECSEEVKTVREAGPRRKAAILSVRRG